jgi:hypothetical protein
MWPYQVRDAAAEVFGGQIHNVNSRTHQTLDRRIQHCLAQWRFRYDWTPQQADYAGEVIAAVILACGRDAKNDSEKYAFTLTRLDRLANDERVHDGMQRRSGRVDVSGWLNMELS